MLTTIGTAIIDFLFPPHCPLCDAYVENQGDWCDECLRATVKPFFVPQAGKNYGRLDGAWAMGVYQGALRDLIFAVKFRGQTDQAKFLHRVTLAADDKLVLPHIDTAAPVPLHESRLKERGFNQAELIFAPWLKQRGLKSLPLLTRVKATRRQYTLKAAERYANISDAFAVTPGYAESVRGQSILLLDDILTTGSTLKECAEVLKNGGAKFVYALVLSGNNKEN